jgi:hypothetical protein
MNYCIITLFALVLMTTTTNALNAQIIADLTGSGSAGYIDCSPCQEGERFRIFQRTIPTSGLTIDIEFGVDGELFELTISDISSPSKLNCQIFVFESCEGKIHSLH